MEFYIFSENHHPHPLQKHRLNHRFNWCFEVPGTTKSACWAENHETKWFPLIFTSVGDKSEILCALVSLRSKMSCISITFSYFHEIDVSFVKFNIFSENHHCHPLQKHRLNHRFNWCFWSGWKWWFSLRNVKIHKADVDFMKTRESYRNVTRFTPQAP